MYLVSRAGDDPARRLATGFKPSVSANSTIGTLSWCCGKELNLRRLRLNIRSGQRSTKLSYRSKKLAGRAGNDPATSCSTGKCSTTEPTTQNQSKDGLDKRTRTSRLMLPKHALYQMSYTEKTDGLTLNRTGWYPEGERIYSPPQSPMLLSIQYWSLVRDSNSGRPASKAGALSMLS